MLIAFVGYLENVIELKAENTNYPQPHVGVTMPLFPHLYRGGVAATLCTWDGTHGRGSVCKRSTPQSFRTFCKCLHCGSHHFHAGGGLCRVTLYFHQ